MPDSTSPTSASDELWMARALDLAERAASMASPNPTVGCVLVSGGEVVGEGFHLYDQKDHAEIVALSRAGDRARGATAYVTLEPCSHQGRTGPCSSALIAAGVSRVVAATLDPNPEVNGHGVERLRNAGIEVKIGVMQEQARRLNDGFARFIRSGLPLVTLKAAMTLDGRIAPAPIHREPARPVLVTGEEARAAVQRMRHRHDALITGINTVLDDDPMLTDRTGLARRRPLLRVVLDSALRLRLDSKLVRSAKNDLLVFCTNPVSERRRSLEALGVRVERIEGDSGGAARVSLKRVIEKLGQMQLTSVMIEAGSQVNTSALSQQLVDRLFLFYAPVFFGANGLPVVQSINEMRVPIDRIAAHRYGHDMAVEGWLRDPWN